MTTRVFGVFAIALLLVSSLFWAYRVSTPERVEPAAEPSSTPRELLSTAASVLPQRTSNQAPRATEVVVQALNCRAAAVYRDAKLGMDPDNVVARILHGQRADVLETWRDKNRWSWTHVRTSDPSGFVIQGWIPDHHLSRVR